MEKLKWRVTFQQHTRLLIPVQRAYALRREGSIITTCLITTQEYCQFQLSMRLSGDDLVLSDCIQENA